jgi:hypothetical protein
VIFGKIDTRGRLKSPLKIKEVSRNILVKSEDADSEYYGFRPAL